MTINQGDAKSDTCFFLSLIAIGSFYTNVRDKTETRRHHIQNKSQNTSAGVVNQQ